jgi:hypothetical protein
MSLRKRKLRFIPGRKGFIPGRKNFIPGRKDFIPGRKDFIPGRKVFIPGRKDFIPGRKDFIPGRKGFIPGRMSLCKHKLRNINGKEKNMSDWLPSKEADLRKLMGHWSDVLNDTAKTTAYGWAPTLVAPMLSKINSFEDACVAYDDDKTPGNRLTKAGETKAVKVAAREFANTSIRFNTKMTDAQKLELGIRPKDTIPSHHPAPAVIPEIDAMPSGRRQHTVTAINPETKDRKRPELVKGVAFAYKLRQPDEPKSNAKDMPSVFQVKAVRVFEWDAEDVGKVADYAVAYENDGAARGKWSEVSSVIVA